MNIACTIKEFGQIVRGCEKADCWKCPLESLCGGDKENGIEKFVIYVDDDGPETGGGEDG